MSTHKRQLRFDTSFSCASDAVASPKQTIYFLFSPFPFCSFKKTHAHTQNKIKICKTMKNYNERKEINASHTQKKKKAKKKQKKCMKANKHARSMMQMPMHDTTL